MQEKSNETGATTRQTCDCCHVTTIDGPHGETGYQLARNVVLCSFCKLLFPAIAVPAVDLSEAELLGAWGDFTQDMGDFHLNLSRNAMRERVFIEDQMRDCLQAWLVGAAVQSDAQNDVSALLWPCEAHRRVLEAIEVAAVIADDLDHEWRISELRGAVERPDVALVWASWLASNAEKGKGPTQSKTRIGSQWATDGEGYIERASDWAKAMAKGQIGKM